MVNGTNGVKTWVTLVQQVGLPTALLGVVGWIFVTMFIQPMSESQANLINANINSQTQLTKSVDAMATSLQESHSFQKVVVESQDKVVETHEEQCKTLEDIRAIMGEAKNQMAGVPEKRDEQIKLLTEIRDNLDVPN